jgi:hypothetical protein
VNFSEEQIFEDYLTYPHVAEMMVLDSEVKKLSLYEFASYSIFSSDPYSEKI